MADRYSRYRVYFADRWRDIEATSAGNAKYQLWLRIGDLYDLSAGEFFKRTRAKRMGDSSLNIVFEEAQDA